MNKREHISEAVVKRLPRYYHCLKQLEKDGISRVSSTVISGMLNITASQVRQDFSNFGEFGQQGYGYDVEFLKTKMAALLGLDRSYNVIVIGAGNIGRALANYQGFVSEGFNVLAVFDIHPQDIPIRDNIPVLPMEKLKKFLKENKVDICFIATNAEAAKTVSALVIKSGIRAVWNFAPVDLYLGENVAVENINMSESLFMLSYKIKNIDKSESVKID